jgi:cell pole-organizing protein PopZ
VDPSKPPAKPVEARAAEQPSFGRAAAAPPPPSPPPPPPPAPEPPPPPEAPEPVLDLTDKIEEEPPRPRIVMEEVEAMENNPLMSQMTEEAAVAAMSRILAQNLAVEREWPGKPGPVTLEDMARELMHPLIKVWLDQNLPIIIEKLVAREIEKLAHRAMDKPGTGL